MLCPELPKPAFNLGPMAGSSLLRLTALMGSIPISDSAPCGLQPSCAGCGAGMQGAALPILGSALLGTFYVAQLGSHPGAQEVPKNGNS
jgi:hypothetical protein